MSKLMRSSIEIVNLDIWDLLFERVAKPFSDSQVIYRSAQNDEAYTYGDVKALAGQLGASLVSQWSWKSGDVLTIFSTNCIDTPIITWACHWAGATVSLANPAYTVQELAHQLKDSGSKALATQLEHLPTVLEAASLANISTDRILLIGSQRDGSSRVRHFRDLLQRDISVRRRKFDPKTRTAFLVYSSGTTGKPKGVMLSHTNIVADILMVASVEAPHLTSGTDKILSLLPYYHIYGLQCLIHLPIFAGIESIVMAKFDLEQFCSLIEKHKITYTYTAPPVVLQLVKSPVVERYNLSSLRMITCGAAPLSKDLINGLYDRLKVASKQAYGLSETSPVTHIQAWDEWKSAMGSVGKALPNLVVKIAKSDGKPAPSGEAGEIWIQGPTVFQGYHQNRAATADCMTSEGFFKTGDVGYEDADGNLFITDRIKELIKYKGFQVAPAELEGILASHPSISDVAVSARQVEEIASEVPVAFLVASKDVKPSKALALDILKWFESQVASHKRLRGGIVWIDEVPKSAAGKILKRELTKIHAVGIGAVEYQTRREDSKL